ncbi:hypothetical protein Ae201684P_002731 [Aphanomyces euteiches]|nr:hypothetical protein Ae201684P_002731 [Aphanomyces euteiches]
MTTWTVGWFKRLRKPRGGGTSAKSKTRSLMERLFPCLLRKRPVDEVMFPPCSPTEMAAYAPPPPPPRVIPREYIHVKTQRVGGKQVPFSRRESCRLLVAVDEQQRLKLACMPTQFQQAKPRRALIQDLQSELRVHRSAIESPRPRYDRHSVTIRRAQSKFVGVMTSGH